MCSIVRKVTIAFLMLLLSGCAVINHSLLNSKYDVENAIAIIHDLKTYQKLGEVRFSKVSEGVKIMVVISGLSSGKHGFHIHEFGDLSKQNGKSAGGHFNPLGHSHAGREHVVRHVGDLGNLDVNKSGKTLVTFIDKKIKLNGTNNIIGRSVIIHAGHDDFSSQPSGNSGERIAGGIIGIAY